MRWLPRRRRSGAHRTGPAAESFSADKQYMITWTEQAASVEALRIFHENQNDRRYLKPYLNAYRGLITLEEADEQILVLAAIDASYRAAGGQLP